jgi:ribosomal-protein-alanine N-acetyltransferase
MADVSLRSGVLADVPAMHRLDCLCFEEVFRFDLPYMRRLVLQRSAIVVIAECDEAIAGFVIFELSARTPELAYVVTLDVHPDHRRAGLARGLMAEAESRARQTGATQVWLHVFAGNEPAICFYERYGFDRVGLMKDFYGHGRNGFSYLKPL